MEGKAIPYTIYLYSTLYLKMSSLSITEQALAVLKAEAAARLAAEQATQATAAAAAAERERLEREARIIAAAERQQALLRAERLEAEQAAAARLVAEQAALAAEVERLRARSPLEILQDEMAEMKRQMAAAARPPEPEALHLRERVIQLDTLYKSSQEEIVALKSVVCDLIALRHDGRSRKLHAGGGNIRAELNAIRGQRLFERLGVPAYFVSPDGNQIHRSLPIDWQKSARDDFDIEYPSLI